MNKNKTRYHSPALLTHSLYPFGPDTQVARLDADCTLVRCLKICSYPKQKLHTHTHIQKLPIQNDDHLMRKPFSYLA